MEKELHSLADAEAQLADTFEILGGVKPKVTLLGRDEKGRIAVAVGYRGNELVASMQVEAFVVEEGDSIRHRSQIKDGNTILVYHIERR